MLRVRSLAACVARRQHVAVTSNFLCNAFSSKTGDSQNGVDDAPLDEEDVVVQMTAEEVESSELIAKTSLKEAAASDRLKFFSLAKEVEQQLFPEGINTRLEDTFDLVGQRHLMLRDPTLDILSVMQNWDQRDSGMTPAFVLDGERGSGKTVALQQIVQYAREDGWLVLYVPNPRSWCYEAPFVTRSETFPGKFDVDVVGAELLSSFHKAHADQLASIPLKNDYGTRYYPTSTYEAKPKESFDTSGLTLKDLVECGMRDDDLSSTAVVDLRTELGQLTETKVLIAVDDYNTWFADTIFGYEGKDVKPQEIAPIDALSDVKEEGFQTDRKLANGLFVAATTENFPRRPTFKEQVDFRQVRKTVRPYSSEELAKVLEYYNHVRFVSDTMDDSERAYFRLMTKGNPLAVFDRATIS